MARRWGNALHFVGIKCFSCHTFAPIDSIFFGSPNSLYSVLPGFRLVEAQLPPIRDEALLPLLYPGMLTVGPERRPYSLLSIRRVPLPEMRPYFLFSTQECSLSALRGGPTPSSPSGVCLPLGCRFFVSLTLQEYKGLTYF